MGNQSYLNVVRNWFELYLSEQREVAESLGLPPCRQSSQFEWGKTVLTVAKEKGELPKVAEAIAAKLAQRS